MGLGPMMDNYCVEVKIVSLNAQNGWRNSKENNVFIAFQFWPMPEVSGKHGEILICTWSSILTTILRGISPCPAWMPSGNCFVCNQQVQSPGTQGDPRWPWRSLPMTDPWCWCIYANIKGVYWWDPCYHIYIYSIRGSYGLWPYRWYQAFLHGLLFQLFLLSLPPASTPAGRGPALPMRELRPSQSTVNSSEASPGAPKNSVENHG